MTTLNSAKHKLKTILKDNMNRRFITSKKWRLNWNKLFNYKTSDRLFSQRLENSWKRYTVEILFDASGSMAHWWWEWVNSNFYKGINIVKQLVKLFNNVVDINIVFYNLREWRMTPKQILHFDMDQLNSVYSTFSYMWEDDMWIEDWHFKQWAGTHISSCQWNWEIINMQNSYERLSKLKSEKVCIVIWDWKMHVDSYSQSEMINRNLHICWKPIKKYNPSTAKEVCRTITKNGVHLLGVALWTRADFSYMPNNTTIREIDEIYSVIVDFMKKSLK